MGALKGIEAKYNTEGRLQREDAEERRKEGKENRARELHDLQVQKNRIELSGLQNPPVAEPTVPEMEAMSLLEPVADKYRTGEANFEDIMAQARIPVERRITEAQESREAEKQRLQADLDYKRAQTGAQNALASQRRGGNLPESFKTLKGTERASLREKAWKEYTGKYITLNEEGEQLVDQNAPEFDDFYFPNYLRSLGYDDVVVPEGGGEEKPQGENRRISLFDQHTFPDYTAPPAPVTPTGDTSRITAGTIVPQTTAVDTTGPVAPAGGRLDVPPAPSALQVMQAKKEIVAAVRQAQAELQARGQTMSPEQILTFMGITDPTLQRQVLDELDAYQR